MFNYCGVAIISICYFDIPSKSNHIIDTPIDIAGLLLCSSGTISIGSLNRFYVLSILCICGGIATFFYALYLKKTHTPCKKQSITYMLAMATSCLVEHRNGYDSVANTMCGF
ncbi:hypothetical protein THRCLA_21079 [Thraustotheca clavata]|uniref:Uncharacterized protein n=1 Tax=Thraustotheca clavata TaxID=74557 RepID=A0A1W0A0E6_9STRA|nr:hypothetical protein THRCLA_21079 [Thraustotheca clavata]